MTNFTILLVAKNQFKGKINDFLRDKKPTNICTIFSKMTCGVHKTGIRNGEWI